MMEVKGDYNNKEIFLQIKNLKNLQDNAIRKAFYNIGKFLLKDAVADINKEPKHGRQYLVRLGRGGKTLSKPKIHTASAENEAPANITGALRAAHNFSVQGNSKLIFGVEDKVNYGAYLENGTKKIKPRKWLIRAIKNNERNIENEFNHNIESELNKK